jgi:UDP-3-O-[3-hydroxymyristoyl] glucosamine N-acyltransferase
MLAPLSLSEISVAVVATRQIGDTTAPITGIAALKSAQIGDLSFLGNSKYKTDVAATRASVVLVPLDYEGLPQANQAYLFVENPSVGLARICARLERELWPRPVPGLHPTAVVAPGVTIPPTATIGPFCVVEEGVKIGEQVHLQAQVFVGRDAVIGRDCWLMPGCVIAPQCILGERVRLQAGVVIGSDGFGYEFANGRHEKVPQVGNVVIENDVEIGANSTLDRARFSQTVVGEGTTIDNLVQVAHNVTIGKHCLVCAQVGISGSTVVEDFVIIGGQAGLAGHLRVGRGAKIDGQTGVNSDVQAGSFVKGSPCLPYQLEQRINVLRRKIPDLFKRVSVLEEHFGVADAEKSSA